MNATAKSRLKLLLKIVLVGGLFYFLFKKGFISVQDTQRAFTQWQYIIPAASVFIITAFLGVARWQWLLRAQDIHLSWMKTTQLTFIGLFFNVALPGAVSGDFVKAFYIGKEMPGRRGRAFGAILFDRVAGLSALVCVSAVGFWFSAEEHLAPVKFMIYLAAAGTIFFYAYLFLVREKHDPVLAILRTLEKKTPKAGSLVRVYEGCRHYHHHRGVVLKVLAVSVLIHLMVGWAVSQFALALGVTGISLLSIYVVVPLGLLVTAVPVLPAGLGTGHAAFLYLFKLLGTDRGADIFTFYALISLLTGALGGLVYLQFRSHEESPDFGRINGESVSRT
jgi:uncharacterized protein (TIRG00374 family)